LTKLGVVERSVVGNELVDMLGITMTAKDPENSTAVTLGISPYTTATAATISHDLHLPDSSANSNHDITDVNAEDLKNATCSATACCTETTSTDVVPEASDKNPVDLNDIVANQSYYSTSLLNVLDAEIEQAGGQEEHAIATEKNEGATTGYVEEHQLNIDFSEMVKCDTDTAEDTKPEIVGGNQLLKVPSCAAATANTASYDAYVHEDSSDPYLCDFPGGNQLLEVPSYTTARANTDSCLIEHSADPFRCDYSANSDHILKSSQGHSGLIQSGLAAVPHLDQSGIYEAWRWRPPVPMSAGPVSSNMELVKVIISPSGIVKALFVQSVADGILEPSPTQAPSRPVVAVSQMGQITGTMIDISVNNIQEPMANHGSETAVGRQKVSTAETEKLLQVTFCM